MDNKEIYKLVYEIVTEAMIVANRAGTIIEANPSAVSLFGYPINQLVGMSVDELLPDALRKIHAEHRANYVKDPQRRSMGSGMNLMAQNANGELIPVEISLNHAEFDGEFRVVALVTDITTRKEAEERMVQINRELEDGVAQRTTELDAAVKALEESQHLYTLIAQNFPDGTINVLTDEFNYVFSEGQDYAQRVERERVIGENYITLLPEKYRKHVTEELGKVMQGIPRSFEIVTNGNTYIMSAVPLYDEDKIDRLL